MSVSGPLHDRQVFAERLRVQLAARHPGVPIAVDPGAFAVRLGGGSTGTALSLAPLHQSCLRDPASAPRLIANFVASVERQLHPAPPLELSPSRLLWCVRGTREIAGLRRAADLLRVDLGAGLVAFIAEALPASIMRGVPHQEWEALGLGADQVRVLADTNTAARFDRLLARMRAADRVPADGWRMAGDPLFQGSVLMVPALLEALHHLAGGDVLLGLPDRGLLLVIAARLPGADRFAQRVLREWREAMHPCSRELLISNGQSVRAVARRGGRMAGVVMPWLQE